MTENESGDERKYLDKELAKAAKDTLLIAPTDEVRGGYENAVACGAVLRAMHKGLASLRHCLSIFQRIQTILLRALEVVGLRAS